LRQEYGIAVLIVSHDLPVHAQLVDRIGVMYAGQIVEVGPIRPTVKNPLHPYTQGLMASIPAIGGERVRLSGIPGTTPSPPHWPGGGPLPPPLPRLQGPRPPVRPHPPPHPPRPPPGRQDRGGRHRGPVRGLPPPPGVDPRRAAMTAPILELDDLTKVFGSTGP